MVSAHEARKISEEAQFSNSGYAALIDSAIREVAGTGNTEVSILVPMDVAEQSAHFLETHGFRVMCEVSMTGMVITAAW